MHGGWMDGWLKILGLNLEDRIPGGRKQRNKLTKLPVWWVNGCV